MIPLSLPARIQSKRMEGHVKSYRLYWNPLQLLLLKCSIAHSVSFCLSHNPANVNSTLLTIRSVSASGHFLGIFAQLKTTLISARQYSFSLSPNQVQSIVIYLCAVTSFPPCSHVSAHYINSFFHIYVHRLFGTGGFSPLSAAGGMMMDSIYICMSPTHTYTLLTLPAQRFLTE
ncbi:hypothetical protein CRM22_005412 [Opisthorchis felineus]|uniref:Uncharacterized protein n=1 Tax=Opisthorchis felineus TaxID=147828 RepID=A0A4S2LR60_OPIFE|nr:hypothetical protein CRM22_005412 [Opisthorchis felineus]